MAIRLARLVEYVENLAPNQRRSGHEGDPIRRSHRRLCRSLPSSPILQLRLRAVNSICLVPRRLREARTHVPVLLRIKGQPRNDGPSGRFVQPRQG
jgi:hypothetical protein